MSIVRELITRLAFQIDQSGVNKFNQTISGFKSGLEGVVTTGFNIADKVINFFSGLSAEAIGIKDIATQTGIAVERFAALRQAAGEFNVQPQQFDQAFVALNRLLQQASYGYGELFNIANQTGLEFRDLNGKLVNTETLFNSLIGYLGKIGSAAERQRIAVNLFGEEVGPRLADLSTQGTDAIAKAAEKYADFGKSISGSIADVQKYNSNLNQLASTFNTLKTKIGNFVFPYLNKALEGLNAIPEIIRDFPEYLENMRVGAELQRTNPEIKRRLAERRQLNENANVGALEGRGGGSVSINMTNNFEFDVPPGTTQEQAVSMQEALKQTLNSHFDEKVRELINNNPQVE